MEYLYQITSTYHSEIREEPQHYAQYSLEKGVDIAIGFHYFIALNQEGFQRKFQSRSEIALGMHVWNADGGIHLASVSE